MHQAPAAQGMIAYLTSSVSGVPGHSQRRRCRY